MTPGKKAISLSALLLCGAALYWTWSSSPKRGRSIGAVCPQSHQIHRAEQSTVDRAAIEPNGKTEQKSDNATEIRDPSPAEEYFTARIRHILEKVPTECRLTSDETDKLVEQCVVFQNVRSALELSLANVKLNNGVLDVVIPAYSEAGGRIRQMLQAKFELIVGPERSAEIWKAVGEDVAFNFDMFGEATQDFVATVQVNEGRRQVRIERTKNWVSDGRPSFSTGVTLLEPSQIADAEYLYMAPLLRKLLATTPAEQKSAP